MSTNNRLCAALALCAISASSASAASLAELKKQYPENAYIIGVGAVRASGNAAADRRVAEVMARYEIAKQIRVRVESDMVDTVCEGNKNPDCRSEIQMVIKQTVDEVLAGSKIADTAEGKGTVTVVAVLPKGDAGKMAADKAALAEQRAREAMTNPHTSPAEARRHYLEALSYDTEAQAVGAARQDAAASLKKLGEDIKAREAK